MLKKFKIGHYTDLDAGTGCTVILPPEENITSAYAMGASPGTREFALLQPDKKLHSITALLLTGGSAFGLNAAAGIVDMLDQKGLGYKTPFANVPIVPAAVIFDLNIGNGKVRPGPEEGKTALLNAHYDNSSSGNVGAGCGATVGKWAGMETVMKGGLGVAQAEHGELKTCAIVVVNSVGDVIKRSGEILAGAFKSGKFLATESKKMRWGEPVVGFGENTVLAAVLTNAKCDKKSVFGWAQRVHLGIARRIEPSHTSYDGDVAFAISTNEIPAPVDTISALVLESVENAVLNAVQNAEPIFGIPAVKSLK